jgi:lysophospholipase L1-like esterase
MSERKIPKTKAWRIILISMFISTATTFAWVEFFGLTWIMGDMVIDASLFWKQHPSIISGVNKDGYRGRLIDFSSSPEGGLRVLCLGDSTTYGIGLMRPSSTYPARLEEILRERLKKKCSVMNRGTPGYTINQGLRVLAEVGPEWKPDAAVFYFGHNEWKTSRSKLTDSNRRLGRAPFMGIGAFLPRISHTARLFQFLRSEWAPIKPVQSPSVRVPLEEFERLVMESFRLCRRMRIEPIWIEYAQLDPDEKQRRYVEKTGELCRENNVEFLEMERLINAGPDVFMSDGVHLKRRGNEIVAALVAEAVIERIKEEGGRRNPEQTNGL